MACWRLIVDGAANGASNMAIDETLLESLEDDAPPILRLYSWRPAALSLGRSQSLVGDRRYLRDEGIDLVRRPTGGQAVLHEFERTYAVIGRLDRAPFGGVIATYGAIAAALDDAFRSLGVETRQADPTTRAERDRSPVCFASPSAHELLAEGRKFVGSAQMRRGSRFLQHGSILIEADPKRLGATLGVDPDAESWTDLTRVLGRRPSDEELDQAIIDAFRRQFTIEFTSRPLSDAEQLRATQLRTQKYLDAGWTLDGRRPSDSAS